MISVTKTNGQDKRYDEALRKAQAENTPLDKIASLLTAAHEAGDARATYALATWYVHGRFFKKDTRKGIALLREAARSNIAVALYELAGYYEVGHGLRKNPIRAASLFLQAALHGDKQSIYEIGRCYYHGTGVQRDRRIAWVWLDRAKTLGIGEDTRPEHPVMTSSTVFGA